MKNIYLTLIFVLISASVASQTITRAITSAANDAEEDLSNGVVDVTSSDLEMLNDETGNIDDQEVGMRFTNITIPSGATVTNASIQFTADNTDTGTLQIRFAGHDTDDAPAFTTANSNISNRIKTTARVFWNPPSWSNGNSGFNERTPNLATIINEIISRPGWNSGNDIVIIAYGPTDTSERSAESAQNGTGPVLTVSYTPPPTIVANNDSASAVSGTANTNLINAIANDTYNGGQATTANTDVTQLSSTNSGISINTNGIVSINSSVPAGNYTLTYRLSQAGVPSNSNNATVSISVATAEDPCDPIASGNLDTDGDGISDICDLDDDNDGILDLDEGLFENIDVLETFQLNGDAVEISSTEFRLTANTTGQSGQAWSKGKVSFDSDFAILFEINLGSNDGGADGVSITFQNSPDGINATGIAGSGLGSANIQNGIVLEIDTFDNEASTEIVNDHTSIWESDNIFFDFDGSAFPNVLLSPPIDFGNLEDGLWHTVEVTWDSSLQSLAYTVDGINAGSISGDLPNLYFDGESDIIFGYTASTGSFSNNQSVRYDPNTILPFATDTDKDGIINSLDLDSDNDGIADIIEAGGVDANNDGEVDYPTVGDPTSMVDANNNGWSSVFDDGTADASTTEGGTVLADPNSDTDTLPNRLDLDADDDGIPDNIEGQTTQGYIAPSLADSPTDFETNRGFYTAYLGGVVPVDTDGDLIPDYLDTDSDNDGLTDLEESFVIQPGGVVGSNGLLADAETADDYTDVNGLAYETSTLFGLQDTDADTDADGNNADPSIGIDFDYRERRAPDLIPAITASPSTVSLSGTIDLTFRITNIGEVITESGITTISMAIFKPVPSNGSLVMDPLPAGWSISDLGSFFVLSTSTENISVGFLNGITFSGVFTASSTVDAEQVFTVVIQEGSGREFNGTNNIRNTQIIIN